MTTPNPTHPVIYGKFLESLLEGRINISQDPMYMMLCNNGYTPNQDVHKFKSDVTHEISGSGYIAGGQTITGLSAVYIGGTKQMTLAGGNLVWPTATFIGGNAPAFGVFYMNPSGFSDTIKPLVGYQDFGGSISVSDLAFYVNWPSTGICTMQVPT